MAAVVFRTFHCSKPKNRILDLAKQTRFESLRHSASEAKAGKTENAVPGGTGKFRVLELYPKPRQRTKTARPPRQYNEPRTTQMKPDEDWTNVWPGPRTFHPATVPLPIRQGCNRYGPPPGKFANTELMKIPNFLHLTPPAIQKHCEAIKKFCTKWPEELETDEDIEKHFPVEIVSSDYCFSSPSIREPKARIISLKIKLKNLELDQHSKDKFLRIVGSRYDTSTDYVTITTDSCPLKKQNYEYAHYLLTAVYFESWKYEEWEKDKSDDDMEEYIFPNRQCYRNIVSLFKYNSRDVPDLKDYGEMVDEWINKGDNRETIQKYKAEVMKLLSLPSLESQAESKEETVLC